MRVGTGTDGNTDSFGRIYRWSAARRFRTILPDKVFTAKIHRVLDGPAHTECFHALKSSLGCIVQMSDRPAQTGYRDLLIHPLEDSQEFIDRCVMFPVHGQGHSLLRGPFDDLIIPVLLSLGRLVVIVHIPGDPFANAV